MDIVFNCPHCGLSLEVDQDAAGQQFDCPTCQKAVTVPDAVAMPIKVILVEVCPKYRLGREVAEVLRLE